MRCQQFTLYGAERSVPTGTRFETVEAIQAFVDALRDTWWWDRYYSQVKRVEVYPRPASRRESVGSWKPELAAGKIEMLEVHWNELVVLHELAHVLAAARFGSQAHCPWFARTYLELVSHVMGPEAYVALHEAFDRDGVDHDIDDHTTGAIAL